MLFSFLSLYVVSNTDVLVTTLTPPSETVRESLRKVRNTARFLLGNLSDFTEQTDAVPYEELSQVRKVKTVSFQ